MAEYLAERDGAARKYAPLVARLSPAELDGLSHAVSDELRKLQEEARAEDIRRGWRPPGTSINR